MNLPINTLMKSKGKNLKIILKNGTTYQGNLEKADEFMNILLLDAEEIIEQTIRYPKVFIKGNNILYIEIK